MFRPRIQSAFAYPPAKEEEGRRRRRGVVGERVRGRDRGEKETDRVERERERERARERVIKRACEYKEKRKNSSFRRW